jgi:BirA family biotin operon repressor/biotin-[acetyl-CoA-carboxylase] ligase
LSADWPAGVARIVVHETGSTNADALAAEPPAWILAHRQTAARGRAGRRWASPEGNFAASLALRADLPADRAALYSFVAALALHDVLTALTSRPLSLKWPNDVLLDGGKVAGILLESVGSTNRLDRLVIGFGVNLARVPDGVSEAALPPVALGLDIAPEAILDRLAPAFAAREEIFRKEGFAPVRDAWLARAAWLGERVTARTPREIRQGVFEDIDASGALVLGTPSGRDTVAAADVFFA